MSKKKSTIAKEAKKVLADEGRIKVLADGANLPANAVKHLLNYLLTEPEITTDSIEGFIRDSDNPELAAFNAGIEKGHKAGHSSGVGKGIAVGLVVGALGIAAAGLLTSNKDAK